MSCKSIQWIGPNGDSINLTQKPFISMPGRKGFGRVEGEIVSDKLTDGSNFVQNYRPATRLISLPISIKGETETEYIDALNRFSLALQHKMYDQSVKPGVIRVTRQDGEIREIEAFYQDGFDGTEDIVDDIELKYQAFPALQFWCPDYAFTGPESVHTFEVDPDAEAFYPIYPIQLASSAVEGTHNFVNDSPEPVYPVWEITGPGTPEVTGIDGGSFKLTQAIPTDYTVTIDMRPVSIAPETGQTVIGEDGENWWDRFDGQFFSFPPGSTGFTMFMPGADQDSKLVLKYRVRYGRAW